LSRKYLVMLTFDGETWLPLPTVNRESIYRTIIRLKPRSHTVAVLYFNAEGWPCFAAMMWWGLRAPGLDGPKVGVQMSYHK